MKRILVGAPGKSSEKRRIENSSFCLFLFLLVCGSFVAVQYDHNGQQSTRQMSKEIV
jgi:hypothetical protein